jgi:hypothetical protein
MTISRAGRAGRAGALVAMLLTVAVAACIDGDSRSGAPVGMVTGIDSGANSTGGSGATTGAPGHIFNLVEIATAGNDTGSLPYQMINVNIAVQDSTRTVNVALDSSQLYVDTSTTGSGYVAERNVLTVTDIRTQTNIIPPPEFSYSFNDLPDTLYGTYSYDDTSGVLTMTFVNTVDAFTDTIVQTMVAFEPGDSLVGTNDFIYTDTAGKFFAPSLTTMTYYQIGTLTAFQSANRVPGIVHSLRAHVTDRNAAVGSSALSAAGLSNHAILQIRSQMSAAMMQAVRARLQARAVQKALPLRKR